MLTAVRLHILTLFTVSLLLLAGCDAAEDYSTNPASLQGVWAPAGADPAYATVAFRADPGYTFVIRRGEERTSGRFATVSPGGASPQLQLYGDEPLRLPGAAQTEPASFYTFEMAFEGSDTLVLTRMRADDLAPLRYVRVR